MLNKILIFLARRIKIRIIAFDFKLRNEQNYFIVARLILIIKLSTLSILTANLLQ